MRIHFLQHVSFEGPASLEDWFREKGDDITVTSLFKHDPLPSPSDVDILIVLGGPMAVSDEGQYPWLKEEKRCLRTFIDARKKIIGICLGAQLIAEQLGASVYKAENKEIGWFPVYAVQGGGECCLSDILPRESEVFHWHGDTFDLPENSVHIFSSKGCRNQAFVVEDRIFAFQFHLETTKQSASYLLDYGRDELKSDFYIQSPRDILENDAGYDQIHRLLDEFLKRIRSASPAREGDEVSLQ